MKVLETEIFFILQALFLKMSERWGWGGGTP